MRDSPLRCAGADQTLDDADNGNPVLRWSCAADRRRERVHKRKGRATNRRARVGGEKSKQKAGDQTEGEDEARTSEGKHR